MTTALSITQGLLGLLFIVTGSFKFFQSREKIIASGGTWAEDFAPGIVRLIAGIELISGVLVLTGLLLGLGAYYTIAGAGCIAVIMIGSIYTHLRRKEFAHAGINLVFLLMAILVLYTNRPT